MRFLIVDDSPTIRRVISLALKAIGRNEIEEASDGEEALGKVISERIEFIITDWNMPVMNGYEFLLKIRNNPDTKTIPVIMVTTKATKEDVIAAFKAGISNYIVKPFTPNELQKKVYEVLNRKSIY